MAGIIYRHKKRWKGKKWINTPFSAKYKKRRAVASALAVSQLVVGLAQIRIIASTPITSLPNKPTALANAIISTHKSVSYAFRQITNKED